MNGIIGGIKANIGTIVKVVALGGAAVGLGLGIRAALVKGDPLEAVEAEMEAEEETEESCSEE